MFYGHLRIPPDLSWKSVDIGEGSETLWSAVSLWLRISSTMWAGNLRYPRLWALVVALLLQLSGSWYICDSCMFANVPGAWEPWHWSLWLASSLGLVLVWPCRTHLAPLAPALSCSHLDAQSSLSLEHLPTGNQLALRLSLQYVFDYQQGDVFGCVADIGWITGHSYVVYGPLCNGATSVLFESTPVYPDPGEEVVGKGLARRGRRGLETCPVWPACSGEVSSIALDTTLRNICEYREGKKKKLSLFLLCTLSSNSCSFGC